MNDRQEGMAAQPDVWRHLTGVDGEAAAILPSLVPDPIAVAALLADETRPRRARFDDGDVVILRGVNLNPGAQIEDMVSLRLWIAGDRIVSVTLREVRAVADTRRRLEDRRIGPTVPDIFLALVENMTERLKEAVRSTEAALEEIEDAALQGDDADHGEALKGLRRRAIWMRRFAQPQLEALEDLLDDPPAWLDDGARARLREVANSTERTVEALSATREHMAAVLDQIDMHLASQTRRTNQVLATVATIFLPLNLLAALLGANVGGVPWATSGYGFWIILAVALSFLAVAWPLVFRFLWSGWPRRK